MPVFECFFQFLELVLTNVCSILFDDMALTYKVLMYGDRHLHSEPAVHGCSTKRNSSIAVFL